MTKIFIGIILALIVAFDIFIISKEGKPSSISAVMIRAAHEYPSVPFLLGFVSGHLFWRMKDKDVYKE